MLDAFGRLEESAERPETRRAKVLTAVGQDVSDTERAQAEADGELPRTALPALTATRLGKGIAIRVGLTEWAKRASTDREVGQITRNIAEAGYFPEWVFTGTFLTDTNAFGRGADPEQMAHAFGISGLAAPTATDVSDAPSCTAGTSAPTRSRPLRTQYPLVAQSAARLFLVDGINMAGPSPSSPTRSPGACSASRRPGAARRPRRSATATGACLADPDYSGIDDGAQIWWDPTIEVDDEFGNPRGSGVWRRVRTTVRGS